MKDLPPLNIPQFSGAQPSLDVKAVNFAATPQPLKVTLMDFPRYPIETIYCAWMASRTEDGEWSPEKIHTMISREREQTYQALEEFECTGIPEFKITPGPLESQVRKVFEDVIDLKIQLAETLDFVFMIDNVSIPLREQMVRHRVGVKFGARLGVDFIPEVGGSTWWSQTMRTLDMSKFLERGRYHIPETIGGQVASKKEDGKEFTAKELYLGMLRQSQDAYQRLIEIGVPAEDARNLLPMAVTHRITWKINLSAILHILGKRSCWIAQLGLWKPLIYQMIEEMATKVDPFFHKLVTPPCIDKSGFKACPFKLENVNRLRGSDPIPPCPLYLHHHEEEAVLEVCSDKNAAWVPITVDGKDRRVYFGEVMGWQAPTADAGELVEKMQREYQEFWGRDVHTGELLQEGSEPNESKKSG